MRIKKRRRDRIGKKWKIGLFFKVTLVFLTFAAFASLAFVLPRIIKISEIVCFNQYGECKDLLGEELGSVKGRSCLHAKKEVERILSEKTLVKDYSVSFKLPSRLEIYLIERKAKYALYGKEERKAVLVDTEGRVVSQVDSTSLPFIVVENALPKLGEIVGQRLLFALGIVFDVNSIYKVDYSLIQNDSLVIELTGGPRVIFPQEGEEDYLLGSLGLILDRLNSLEDEFTIERRRDDVVIDMRFDKPVIRFKSSE